MEELLTKPSISSLRCEKLMENEGKVVLDACLRRNDVPSVKADGWLILRLPFESSLVGDHAIIAMCLNLLQKYHKLFARIQTDLV